MYAPKYSITNKILRYFGIIDACREVITNAPLVPSWEAKFREEAIIRTVHFGTHLEGNELNFTEAAKVLGGGQIIGRERDVQEVINYRNVLKFIEEMGIVEQHGDTEGQHRDKEEKEYAKEERKKVLGEFLTEEIVKKIHKLTVEKILPKEQCGTYRTTQVVIRNSVTGEITFRPPPAVEVPFLMEDFISWLSSLKAAEMHPVLRAGVTHYELVRIHPFIDGNGRVARACATLVLFAGGYDVKRFFSLEEHYDSDAGRYYEALSSVMRTSDLTGWLEYFTEGLAIELNRIKEKVQRLSVDLKMKKRRGQIALNERQIKLLEYIQSVGFVNNRAYRELFPMISEDTILRDLQQLVKMRIIKKEGSTKKARYIMRS